MKRMLLLSTGGTIASRPGESGLEPQMQAKELLGFISDFCQDYEIQHEDILNLDSSNIQPEQWQLIARKIYARLEEFDGIIVTHGTDTMAYTASAVSFMLQNLKKSVVFTGSQLPIDNPLTDARTNLYTAIAAVESGITGVTVAFNRKIINGTRTVKISTMGFDAFDSINTAVMGQVFADGMRVFSLHTTAPDPAQSVRFQDRLCTDVFLLKLLPGTKPEIFDALAGLGYRGVVVEAFGAGGMHYVQRDLLHKLESLTAAGISVVVCSQCLYERSDLSIYEVGQRMLARGVISGGDMTTEAAATKLMWALGQTEDSREVVSMFGKSYAGEVTL